MRLIIASALAAMSFSAAANELSYTYLEGGYQEVRNGSSIDGFVLGISGQVAQQLFVVGSYDELSRSGVKGRRFSGGVGGFIPVAPTADFYGQAEFVRARVSARGFGSESDNGFALEGGFRTLFTPNFEGNASVRYEDVFDDEEVELGAGARLHFLPEFSGALDYARLTDAKANQWRLTARYSFGG